MDGKGGQCIVLASRVWTGAIGLHAKYSFRPSSGTGEDLGPETSAFATGGPGRPQRWPEAAWTAYGSAEASPE